jgi:hypothetical protein
MEAQEKFHDPAVKPAPLSLDAAAVECTATLANCIGTLRLVETAANTGQAKIDPKLVLWVKDSIRQAQESITQIGEARAAAMAVAA